MCLWVRDQRWDYVGVVVAGMLWNRVVVHLHMRVLNLMALEVNLQVTPCGESVPADIAFEGPLSWKDRI